MSRFNVAMNQDDDHLIEAPVNFMGPVVDAIIPGLPSAIIRVYKLFLVVSAPTNLTFQDGGNPLSGPLPFVANMSIVLDFDTKPWFTTSAGNPFNINVSGAAQVSGSIYYVVR
jgi:hypothetical protein